MERAVAAGEECGAPERGEVSAWVCGLCVADCDNLQCLFGISIRDFDVRFVFLNFVFSISRTRLPEPAVSQHVVPQDPLCL